ncbi:pimeloyl-ACP methyl ester carboxylesterase [Tamaricihabitans halophyticus]|uniref:Pimeloyl-ACP methyl ester carboxylesterase n=1 Tax=Tamaricihabitans halophyticus TaxID=1262583 RepID=A0A4R2RDM3_9PSEU|nr:alpha/beta hydrolase [Tamaricihabitans halophyticus]TCP57505.1 pimeloyl-ACP methyl ester carboxylesterase [Tamaricihabitans halophyticus]
MAELGGFRDAAAEQRYRTAYQAALREWPDYTSHTVPTSFGTTQYYRSGRPDGMPVVLLPGANSAAPSWASIVRLLGDHRPVIALDTIGDAGLSVQTRPVRNGAEYASWLAEVLDTLDLPLVHLVGLSYGGWLALNQAIHRPDALATVSAIEPARALAGLAPTALIRMVYVSLRDSDELRRRFLRWSGCGTEPATPLRELQIAGLRDYRKRATPMPQKLSDAQLAAIRVPTLVMLGGRSRLHNSKRANARARLHIPNVSTVGFPTASHALPSEFSAETARRLLAFMATHPG